MIGPALVAVHVVVAGWALIGLAEIVVSDPPWPPLSNAELPRAVLLVHWPLMLAAGATFLGGYLTRWRRTPTAMAVAYAALAAMCAVETLGFLTGPSRFAAMAAEYAAYLTILGLLFRTPLRARFTDPLHRRVPLLRRST